MFLAGSVTKISHNETLIASIVKRKTFKYIDSKWFFIDTVFDIFLDFSYIGKFWHDINF